MLSDIATNQRAKAYYETYGPPKTPAGEPISFEDAFTSQWMSAKHLLAEAFRDARVNKGIASHD
jgi:hypothetical protein